MTSLRQSRTAPYLRGNGDSEATSWIPAPDYRIRAQAVRADGGFQAVPMGLSLWRAGSGAGSNPIPIPTFPLKGGEELGRGG